MPETPAGATPPPPADGGSTPPPWGAPSHPNPSPSMPPGPGASGPPGGGPWPGGPPMAGGPRPGVPYGPGGPGGPPPGVGWYSGPLPVPALLPREGIGRAVGRTVAKVTAAMVTIGILGTVGLVVFFGIITALATSTTSTTTTGSRASLDSSFVAGSTTSDNVLLAVPITGTILGESESGDAGGLFAGNTTYGYSIKEKLEAAAERDDIKGIVLEMDTPGGTIFGAKAIADAVAAYKERTGRPVIAYVRSMSASGGMYAMAGADRIVADHGTLIGSIGVIFGPITSYENVVATDGGILGGGVTTTGGITQEYITAGRSKDIGNPFRKLTDEERATLRTAVENAYTQFVDHVATGRGLTAEALRGDVGALIYDEETARTKGLIDEVGNRDVAYEAAASAAQLSSGNWQVQRLQRPSTGLFGLGLSRLAGGAAADAASGATPTATALCARGPVMLAYYGDPAVLCGN